MDVHNVLLFAIQQGAKLWSSNSIGLPKNKTAEVHNQENMLQSPDSFSLERLGLNMTFLGLVLKRLGTHLTR